LFVRVSGWKPIVLWRLLLLLIDLVEKIASGACFHIHMLACSAWNYVEVVEKNAYHTPKQEKKNNAKTKQSPFLRQSCGILKTAPPTQRQKLVLDFPVWTCFFA
jgi:hypothetical protein